MTEKTVDFTITGDSVVFHTQEYMNDVEGERLDEICTRLLADGKKRFVVDLSGTGLINSIAVSILIGMIEKVRTSGGDLVFSGLSGVNKSIFDKLGLSNAAQVFDTEEEALKGPSAP